MTKDTKLSELVINKLTTAQYDGIEEKDPNQLYIVTDAPGFEESITNCITKIPQDIKLELVDGTLTLKAGSKVYVPNGAGVFDIVTISADRTATGSSMGLTTGSALVFSRFDTQDIWAEVLTESGTGTPTNPWTTYYNTNENKVYRYQTDITTPVYQSSFPIAKISFSNSTVTSIDQVFNGFGYIGSTVFALPGVKGLIPDGRNADGTLKNIEIVNPTVKATQLLQFSGDRILLSNHVGGLGILYDLTSTLGGYDYETNLIYRGGGAVVTGQAEVGKVVMSNGVITSLQTKQPFHAVDYNDSSWIAQQAMPSNRYDDLTLGASGTTYTAPANGYFYLAKNSTASGQTASIRIYKDGTTDVLYGQEYASWNTDINLKYTWEVRTGTKTIIDYTLGGTTNIFRFIYAEGEN